MKRMFYLVAWIIVLLLFLSFLNSFLIIKSTQTSDNSNKFGLRLGEYKTTLDESKIIEDKPKEVPIGKFEEDIQKDKDKDDDEDEEDAWSIIK